jgi:hypothetical protein
MLLHFHPCHFDEIRYHFTHLDLKNSPGYSKASKTSLETVHYKQFGMIDISKVSKEDLEKLMEARLKAIPTAHLSAEQQKQMLERNREQDRKNVEHTLKILHDRQSEALVADDRKKKYAAIAVARDQQDQFNLRNRIHELENQFEIMRKTIPEEDWLFLEPLCETVSEDAQFWDRCRAEGGTSEQEIHRCFKEEFEIQPKYIVKLIELIKIRQEIKKLEATELLELGKKSEQTPADQ